MGTAGWFTASEVDALVVGVEAERLFPADIIGFALRKLHDPAFRVTTEHALCGARSLPRTGRGPSLGEVLHTLGLELTGIELGPLDATAAPRRTREPRTGQPARRAA